MYLRHRFNWLHCLKPLLLAAAWLAVVLPAGESAASTGITLGVFPRHPALETRQHFMPLARELAERLGEPVHLDVPPDFPALWERIRDNRYQLVHYNAYHYIRAHHEFQHHAIAMNEERGEATIRSAIWIRRDTPANKVLDLKRGKIVFGGGRDAMVSHIMALDLLQRAGLAPSDYTSQFTINPSHALLAVYFHQSLAAGFAADIPKGEPWGKGADPTLLIPLVVSEPVAQHPWAVADAVESAQRARIRTALLSIGDTEQGQAALKQAGMTGIAPASDHDYDPHREIVLRVLGERY